MLRTALYRLWRAVLQRLNRMIFPFPPLPSKQTGTDCFSIPPASILYQAAGKNRRTARAEIKKLAISAVTAAGMVCRVFLIPTAPK